MHVTNYNKHMKNCLLLALILHQFQYGIIYIYIRRFECKNMYARGRTLRGRGRGGALRGRGTGGALTGGAGEH